MELINVICHWAMYEDNIDLGKPPNWILEHFNYEYPEERLEFSMDFLCILGKFQKYPNSKVYVPLKNTNHNIDVFGLLD
ncbi:conserved hypothetical protein [Methanococcus maripaludis C5]|uniref:Uncharacterized protein n=1 Tax=Methanococcus maripaludis (strain C5 / ATCC BAA-1333) TaxID=402880 RepID=A4FZ56_METM5|nr:hypothetical protein [Methanococcus maripaludis]ABO35490.1 conserved hypothetical protein [Methanococcus maripaludis C5]